MTMTTVLLSPSGEVLAEIADCDLEAGLLDMLLVSGRPRDDDAIAMAAMMARDLLAAQVH
jgi:hypothetical protein